MDCKELDGWDPMTDDFTNNLFNGYNRNAFSSNFQDTLAMADAAKRGTSKKTTIDAVVLHVSHIPTNFDKEILNNLFLKAGNVLRINLLPPRNDHPDGVNLLSCKVTYGSEDEAYKAISMINMKSPFYLHVAMDRTHYAKDTQIGENFERTHYGNNEDRGGMRSCGDRDGAAGGRNYGDRSGGYRYQGSGDHGGGRNFGNRDGNRNYGDRDGGYRYQGSGVRDGGRNFGNYGNRGGGSGSFNNRYESRTYSSRYQGDQGGGRVYGDRYGGGRDEGDGCDYGGRRSVEVEMPLRCGGGGGGEPDREGRGLSEETVPCLPSAVNILPAGYDLGKANTNVNAGDAGQRTQCRITQKAPSMPELCVDKRSGGKVCDSCKRENAVRMCGNCHIAYYCDLECQMMHWYNHKSSCLGEPSISGAGIASAAQPPPVPAKFAFGPNSSSPDVLPSELAKLFLSKEQKTVVPLPVATVEIPCDRAVKVTIVHHEHVSDFYLQVDTAENEVLQICQQTLNSTLKPTLLRPVAVGDWVSCCSSLDDNRHRAEVLEILTNGSALVRFVDYGSNEMVSIKDLLPLSDELKQYPRQAVLCGLYNDDPTMAEWTDGDYQNFRSLGLNRKQLYARTILCKADGKLMVELTNAAENGLSLLRMLKKRRPQLSVVPARQSCVDQWSSGQVVQLVVMAVENPDSVWAFEQDLNSSYVEELATTMKEISPYCEKLPPTTDVKIDIDTLVAAKSLDDGCWYRGVVSGVDSTTIPVSYLVRYLDFGNVEFVTTVVLLPERFCGVCSLAVQLVFEETREVIQPGGAIYLTVGPCRNTGVDVMVRKSEDGFNVKALALSLWTFVERQKAIGVVQPKVVAAISTVSAAGITIPKQIEEVVQPKVSNATDVIPAALPVQTLGSTSISSVVEVGPTHYPNPKRPPPVLLAARTEVVVGVLESPTSVHVQMPNMITTLGKLTDAVAADPDSELHGGVVPGQLVCASYYDSGMWYRAEVLELEAPADVWVRYVDFGNQEKLPLKRLRQVPKAFRTIPAGSREVVPNTSVGFDALKRLLVPGSRWTMTLGCEDDGLEPPLVILQDKQGRSLDQMLSPCAAVAGAPAAMVAMPPPASVKIVTVAAAAELRVGSCVDVVFTYIKSPNELYLCCYSDLRTLHSLNIQLYVRSSIVPKTTYHPKKNDYCIARCLADGAWYRGRVYHVGNGRVHVYFIDFGNVEILTIDNVQHIDSGFTELAACAVRCSLKGNFDFPEWPEDLLANFKASLPFTEKFSVEVVAKTPEGRYVIKIPSLEKTFKEMGVLEA